MSEPILSVRDLSISFHTEQGIARVVEGVSFDLYPGETVGLVGESGSGKTVTALSLLGLLPQPAGFIEAGSIRLLGEECVGLSGQAWRTRQGSVMSMIFQEPMTALDPVFRVGQQMSAVLRRHRNLTRHEANHEAVRLMGEVGLTSPEKRLRQYPHELSGGMRQRVMIAMALSCNPKVLLADEPTTALDVTTQQQVLSLIAELQATSEMAMLLVTHDLGVVAEVCSRVLVMYCGEIIEAAPVKPLFDQPRHPYTQGLLAALPKLDQPRLDEVPTIEGQVPSVWARPSGCRFATRCQYAQPQCQASRPALTPQGLGQAACWYPLGGKS